MSRPRHRTHTGWLDEVLFRPEIPRRVKKMFTALLEHGTYRNKAMNQYACTRTRLAELLEIDERNVQRSIVWAIDTGWLVICVRGQKGRQQVYHRSTPWDHPRYWKAKPCPTCQWRSRGGRAGVQSPNTTPVPVHVDNETGEIQGDDLGSPGTRCTTSGTPVQGGDSTAYNVSQNVSPICSTSARVIVLRISDPMLGNIRHRLAPLARVA